MEKTLTPKREPPTLPDRASPASSGLWTLPVFQRSPRNGRLYLLQERGARFILFSALYCMYIGVDTFGNTLGQHLRRTFRATLLGQLLRPNFVLRAIPNFQAAGSKGAGSVGAFLASSQSPQFAQALTAEAAIAISYRAPCLKKDGLWTALPEMDRLPE